MSSPPPVPPRLLTGPTLPIGVMDLAEPPARLYLTGSLPPGPRVAIVGTRRPTREAYRFAQELALELAQAGVAVVSGGAIGIDTAAHEGALRAGAGTLVVAPASYCCPYPEENRLLFRRIVDSGGGYLTLFDQPTVARRHVFFARNALLASLCVAVILVQAPFRSGARNTLHWARTLKRPFWVVPHAPWCSQGASSVVELRSGGRPLAAASDVLTWLKQNHYAPIPLEATMRLPFPPAERGTDSTERDASPRVVRGEPVRRKPPAVEDTQRDVNGPHRDVCKLVTQLARGPRHPDELCMVLEWEPAHLQATVLHATLLGEVRRNDAGMLVACSMG